MTGSRGQVGGGAHGLLGKAGTKSRGCWALKWERCFRAQAEAGEWLGHGLTVEMGCDVAGDSDQVKDG